MAINKSSSLLVIAFIAVYAAVAVGPCVTLASAQSNTGNTMSAPDTGRATYSSVDNWLHSAATNPLPACNAPVGRIMGPLWVSDHNASQCVDGVPYLSGGSATCSVICKPGSPIWAVQGVNAAGLALCPATSTTMTSTLSITSTNNGTTYSGYRISTTSGPCVTITGATNITISNSNIGPCGGTSGSSNTTDSTGIEITGGSSNIAVYDSYIHPETTLASGSDLHDLHNAIYDSTTTAASGNIYQGNVIGYGDRNIVLNDLGGGGQTVLGNATINPLGDNTCGSSCQSAGNEQGNGILDASFNTTIKNNFIISCRTTGGGAGTGLPCSSIPSLTGGTVTLDTGARGSADTFIVNDTALKGGTRDIENNYSLGGGEETSSTCMLIRSTNGVVTLKNGTGIQCSNASSGPFAVNSGSQGSSFTNMKFFDNNSGAHVSQVAALIGNASTGPWTNLNWSGSNSNGDNIDSGGTHNGEYCFGAACNTVISETNDFWDTSPAAAWPTLSLSSTVAQIEAAVGSPPLIPPLPKSCIANSPITNRTN